MRTRLVNGRVLIDGALRDDVAIVIDGGRIAAIEDHAGRATDGDTDLEGAILAPGFIDTQVNGGGGALFNADPTVDCIATIGAAHRRFGATGFLPTLISDDLEVVDRGIEAVEAAIARGVPGVLGIHIEGPFLNASRKGVHDASKFRTLDDDAIALLTRLTSGRTLVTLAPELAPPGAVRTLAGRGVIVAAGHTDAAYEQVRAALDDGLAGFTHLYNAMTQLGSRTPGAVGAALEDRDSWCGLIVDGHHVDPVVLKLALRCRPRNRFMLVTDAMPSVGSPEDHFMLQGRRITVRDGLCLDPDGVLAGSDLNMAAAVRNARDLMDLDLPSAVALATANPAEFLGLGAVRGRIEPGFVADLALLDDDLMVVETWIGGRRLRNAAAN